MPNNSDSMETFTWEPPAIDLETVKTGDMPGDRIQINQSHIDKANTVFPHVLAQLDNAGSGRLVVSVYGDRALASPKSHRSLATTAV